MSRTLPRAVRGEGAEVGLKKRRSHHVDGITIVSWKSVEWKKKVDGV